MYVHGMEGTSAYNCYYAMRDRCGNPNSKRYKDWGGRGIGICDRWMRGFVYFWQDMGPTYREGLTIERRDNDKGYSPDNCYWTTMHDQTRNRRSNIWVRLVDGREMILADAAAVFGIRQNVAYARLRNGWPESRILERLWIGSRSPPKFDPSRACTIIPHP